MEMKFIVEMSEKGQSAGLTVKDTSSVEVASFLGMTLDALIHEMHAFGKKIGMSDKKAAALTLEMVEMAMSLYADEIGKGTMQEAYEIHESTKGAMTCSQEH